MQGEATGRAIKLARLTKAPLYVVHVMSKDAAEEIVKGRATGQKVWGEVVAGAIGLTDQKWSVVFWSMSVDEAFQIVMHCVPFAPGDHVRQYVSTQSNSKCSVFNQPLLGD